ncbi:enoyl-CoA hydratase [Burkholderia multivorans]|nr:enoyl-CoA hydratase [Burkholderia multivorans]
MDVGCIESRLFRAHGNAARKGKRSRRCAAVWSALATKEEEPRSRNDVVKKVVDELRNSVHNLASLLLTTQRCWARRSARRHVL